MSNQCGSSTCPNAKFVDDITCSDVVLNDPGAILFTERVSANEGVTHESMSGGFFDPWNTESGEEHLDELHERCQEWLIPQRLQSAYHQIIDSKYPQRFRDLLLFLTATEPKFSRKDNGQDTTDVTNIDVIQLQQQHHFAPCIYEQWRILGKRTSSLLRRLTVEQTNTAWCVGETQVKVLVMADEGGDDETSGRTQLVVHAHQSPIRAKSLKRAHPTTSDEMERHKGQVKNKHTKIVLNNAAGGQAALTCPNNTMLTNGFWQNM